MSDLPPSSRLARQVINVIEQGAVAGVDVLQTLLQMGTLEADTPVGRGGEALAGRVLEVALDRGRKNLHDDIATALLTGDPQGFGGPGFFCRRVAAGEWAPLAWLHTLHARPGQASRGGARRESQMDRWFAALLPSLELPQEDANEALAAALALGLTATVNGLWDKADKLAMVNGYPVIAHARHVGIWQRFLTEGGNPEHLVEGVPLWRRLAPANPTQAPRLGLAGGVERWAWRWLAQGKGREEDRQWLEKSIDRRLKGGSKLEGQDWVDLLAATPFPGPRWSGGEGRLPAWEEAARTDRNLALLDALERSALARRVDKTRIMRVRADILAERAARSLDPEEQMELLGAWESFLADGGEEASGVPAVLLFMGREVDREVGKKLKEISDRYPRAWWGTEEGQTEERILEEVLTLAKGGKLTQGKQWMSPTAFVRLVQERDDHPAISLALGVMLLSGGKKDPDALALMEKGRQALGGEGKGAARRAILRDWVAGWKPRRRQGVEAVLASVEMDDVLPAARAHRARQGGRL